jgi:hypothetical protein
MTNITPIIAALVLLISALFSVYLIPLIRSKTNDAQLREIEAWVRIAVAAAEQLYSSAQGQEKKNYVLNFLTDHGYEVDFNEINNMIEAEVLKLHAELYGATR